jgi:FkbM family methyltransferase
MNHRKLLKYITQPFTGKLRFQWLFELMYEFSMKGQNIGMGRAFRVSGESWVADYIVKYFKSQKDKVIIFDVGANSGEHAAYFLKRCGYTIYSFEPLPGAFQRLVENTRDFENAININSALGDKIEQATLYTPTEFAVQASLHKIDFSDALVKVNANKKIKVSVNTLDNFCKTNKISKIHFLKVDIEGHELQMFDGSKDMLSKNLICFIQFEFGGGINPQFRIFFKDFWNLFSDNYKIYRVLQNGLYEIKNYDVRWEQYYCTNFVAELKDKSNFIN